MMIIFGSAFNFEYTLSRVDFSERDYQLKALDDYRPIDNLEVGNTKAEPITEPVLEPTAGLSGIKDIVVICVHYADDSSTRWTPTEVDTIVMPQLNEFWQNVSLGTMSLDWDVKGWYSLADNEAVYGDLWKSKSFLTIWSEAIVLADPDTNFGLYDYIIVLINGHWWRGVSTVGKNYHLNTDEGTSSVAITLVGENSESSFASVWGRIAHEMGHSFGLSHSHGDDYNSHYSLMAKGYPANLNMYHHLVGAAAIWWYDPNDFLATVPVGDSGTFSIHPRSRVLTAGLIQCVKVPITSSRYFLIENVLRIGSDSWRAKDGILITFVDENRPNDDECFDYDPHPETDTISDVLLDVSDKMVNATYNIEIEVLSEGRGNVYTVNVINQGDKIPDLKIMDWGNPEGSPPPYESLDIWCDSPANGYGVYRHRLNGIPVGIGDEPWIEHNNRLFARVRNVGTMTARDVKVTFYYNEPIGAGDTGSWVEIDSTIINLIEPYDVESCFVNWRPELNSSFTYTGDLLLLHSCIKVVIEGMSGEIDLANNVAQENIDYFEATSNDLFVYSPIYAQLQVRNPTEIPRDIYIGSTGFNGNWTIRDLAGAYVTPIGTVVTLAPLASQFIVVALTPEDGTPLGEQIQLSILSCIEDEPGNNETNDVHLVPVGGMSITITTAFETEITLEGEYSDEKISLTGTVSSPDNPEKLFPGDGGDKYVYLQIYSELLEKYYYAIAECQANGEFSYAFECTQSGDYLITAYYAGSEMSTASRSAMLLVETGGFTPTSRFAGLTIMISIGAIVTTAVASIYISRRRKQ